MISFWDFQNFNKAQNKSHGFTLVGDAGQNVSLGNKLKKTAELFDIISNNGDVDHPLCEECTDTLLERLVYPPKMFWKYINICFLFLIISISWKIGLSFLIDRVNFAFQAFYGFYKQKVFWKLVMNLWDNLIYTLIQTLIGHFMSTLWL